MDGFDSVFIQREEMITQLKSLHSGLESIEKQLYVFHRYGKVRKKQVENMHISDLLMLMVPLENILEYQVGENKSMLM